jgi:hypothetical protein
MDKETLTPPPDNRHDKGYFVNCQYKKKSPIHGGKDIS